MDKNYLMLLNKLREPLGNLGILVDDLDTKTLNKCSRILPAIEAIVAERRDHEKALERLVVSFVSIGEKTGIDRKSLAENPVYRKIIESFKTVREAMHDKEVERLTLELERYKKIEADVVEIKAKQMEINLKYAEAVQGKEDAESEWSLTKESLQQANERIKDLEKENMKLLKILEAYKGLYPTPKA